MKLEALKTSALNYMSHFTMYDYMAYAWLILLFFVFILLSIFLAKKKLLISILMFMISLAILFFGPFVLKHYLDIFLRPTEIKNIQMKKLNFTDALIVTGEIKNISKMSFSLCGVNVSVLKASSSALENFANSLKPLLNKSMFLDKTLDINETKEFRVVFDYYTYDKDINISVQTECY